MWLCFQLSVRTYESHVFRYRWIGLQVSAHWPRALVEVTWMGELLDD